MSSCGSPGNRVGPGISPRVTSMYRTLVRPSAKASHKRSVDPSRDTVAAFLNGADTAASIELLLLLRVNSVGGISPLCSSEGDPQSIEAGPSLAACTNAPFATFRPRGTNGAVDQ